MSKQKSLAVVVNHDRQIGVWYVVSADIPGLHVEAETLDELVSIVADLAPELISANLPGAAEDTPICIQHVVDAKPAFSVCRATPGRPTQPMPF